jgi:hypothetical protein
MTEWEATRKEKEKEKAQMVEQTRSAGRKEPCIACPRVNEGKVPNAYVSWRATSIPKDLPSPAMFLSCFRRHTG